MVSSLNIVNQFFPHGFVKDGRSLVLVLLDVLHQEQHVGVALHLSTDKVEHLVVPVCQRFALQLPAEVIHQLVLVWVNRQPGNLVQPLAGQFQIGAAIGVEQLFSSNVSFIGLYLRIKKGPALCRPDVTKKTAVRCAGRSEMQYCIRQKSAQT